MPFDGGILEFAFLHFQDFTEKKFFFEVLKLGLMNSHIVNTHEHVSGSFPIGNVQKFWNTEIKMVLFFFQFVVTKKAGIGFESKF